MNQDITSCMIPPDQTLSWEILSFLVLVSGSIPRVCESTNGRSLQVPSNPCGIPHLIYASSCLSLVGRPDAAPGQIGFSALGPSNQSGSLCGLLRSFPFVCRLALAPARRLSDL